MIDSVADSAGAAVDLKRARRRTTASAEPARADRLPPHSLEAEHGVLGCILLSPNDCLGECIEKLKSEPEVFYDLRHQTIYTTLVEMYDRREAIDLITVQQRLKDKGLLEQIGGIAYLSSLQDAVPSAANLSYYQGIVQEKFLLRRMVQTCTNVVSRVYDYEGEVEALLDEAERDILRISESRVQGGAPPIKELVKRAIDTAEFLYQRQGKLTGIGTGLLDFDRLTNGLHGGEMIVIAGRPSMGKTALALNISEHVAIDQRLPVGIFSLEMTAESLVLRMLCSRARVSLRSLQDGFSREEDFSKMTLASGKLSASPLFIDDSSGLSILQLRAKARRLHLQFGIKLFVVDYLQLLHSTSRRAENRQQEISDISGGIKALAKELNVPVIVLSQLNREPEKRERGAEPRLSDLRESGAIEQDADLVGLLYHPGKSGGDDDDDGGSGEGPEGLPVNLLIAKQRNGPTGDVNLTFLKSYTRFESAAKVSDEDLPGD